MYPNFRKKLKMNTFMSHFRLNSSVGGRLLPRPSPDSIYVMSIPITSKVSYVFCNHDKVLSPNSNLKIPWVAKMEKKIVNLVAKGWSKVSSSETKLNKRITHYVTALLDGISYREGCLKSFPSKKLMIRELKRKTDNEHWGHDSTILLQSQIEVLNIPVDQIKNIPLYHPPFQEAGDLLKFMNQFKTSGMSYHKKNSIACALGIPITLPIALIPIIPNVPGLYLSYRLYCNIKAILGAKHLDYLLEMDANPHSGIARTKHLDFKPLEILNSAYDQSIIESNGSSKEKILITKEGIHDLCANLNMPLLELDLLKALKEEATRIASEPK